METGLKHDFFLSNQELRILHNTSYQVTSCCRRHHYDVVISCEDTFIAGNAFIRYMLNRIKNTFLQI